MNSISYSPMALNDLDEIWEYIALELSAPDAAQKTVSGILDAVDRLNEHSKLGSPLYFEDGLFSGYRYVRYNEYLAFYRLSGNNVKVDRIIYGRRDYMKVLFGGL
ncbi:MAG: type II toxin-antitoxin system RelE/ParE family toxin [Ruminococcus sp.]|nr:type II toxin-antitoxin system RelE/ParE family toxin [Ruminococcus sp.]